MPLAFLFDFNGVIVDDEPQHCRALIGALAELQVPFDRTTYYRDYLGLDDRECFRRALAGTRMRVDDQGLAALIERKHQLWRKEIDQDLALVPGVDRFIRAAARDGYRMAVVSGALRREVEFGLSRAGLDSAFEHVVGAEDVAAGKPDPAGYRRGLELLGVPGSEAVAFEDSLPGYDAARSAGAACVMIATSYPAETLTRAPVVWRDFTDHRPEELVYHG